MCKRKNIIEKIKGLQKEVNFRLDYFARPGALDKLFEKMPKDMEYFEYKPTEEEQQIIGFDDVASCLQKSLTELLFYSCKVLRSRDERDVTIYIHRNFVSVQTFTSSSDENEEVLTFVVGILQPFLEDSDINIEDISCRITFSKLDVKPADIWTVFDRSAFPVLDNVEVISGIYQDTHQVDNLFIDLIRNIQTNDNKNIDGVVSATALFSEEQLRIAINKDGLKKTLNYIVDESIGEITRCFTE